LHHILECTLDNKEIWGNSKDKKHLLAVITPCKTEGKDATKVVVEYTVFKANIVTDLQAVRCVIGRVQRQNTWGIIDRSMDEARPEFLSNIEGTRLEDKKDENSESDDIRDEELFS